MKTLELLVQDAKPTPRRSQIEHHMADQPSSNNKDGFKLEQVQKIAVRIRGKWRAYLILTG